MADIEPASLKQAGLTGLNWEFYVLVCAYSGFRDISIFVLCIVEVAIYM